MTDSIVICINPLTAIMQEQTQRFCKVGIASGFVGESQKDSAVRWKVLNGLFSPVILAQKMGQPLTNCNINNFNCF